MSESERWPFTIVCPMCKQPTRPKLIEIVQAFPKARPPIPKRAFVECMRTNSKAQRCGNRFYINAENKD